MGGIRVDEDSRVLTVEGKPILGLYAAGETTGGLHGSNRLGGNGVCDTMVFGPNAAKQSARYISELA
jgi:fumarate reductase flavoprotein subunit